MSSRERAEDVAVEQRARRRPGRSCPRGHGELGPLRGEQAADRPLVVVARAVVGQHGEAHRAVERRGRRRERAAGRRPCRRRSRPRRSRCPAGGRAGRRRRRPPACRRGRRGHLDPLAAAHAPAQHGLVPAHAQQVRAARERRVRRVRGDTRSSTRSSRPRRSRRRATSPPSAPSARRARVRRRWSSSSRGEGSAGSTYRQGRQRSARTLDSSACPPTPSAASTSPCATRS